MGLPVCLLSLNSDYLPEQSRRDNLPEASGNPAAKCLLENVGCPGGDVRNRRCRTPRVSPGEGQKGGGHCHVQPPI